MKKIKFSHDYPKLHGQKMARLSYVVRKKLENLSNKFIEYDTRYDGGKYELKEGFYLVLVFLGDELIPFTTVRRWTLSKYKYYHSSIGDVFSIEIGECND